MGEYTDTQKAMRLVATWVDDQASVAMTVDVARKLAHEGMCHRIGREIREAIARGEYKSTVILCSSSEDRDLLWAVAEEMGFRVSRLMTQCEREDLYKRMYPTTENNMNYIAAFREEKMKDYEYRELEFRLTFNNT